MLVGFLKYIINQRQEILFLLLQHIQLTAFSVMLAILIGVPLGILVKYVQKLNKPVLGFANIIQAIPSMALLGFTIPFLGIGTAPAVTMVILYSLLPIIKNTYTGLSSISSQMVEAAKGIGLTKSQILFKVQLPLALPVIMAGVRISAVTAVGLMTIAAYIGAGGLGYLVFSGIRTINNYQILAGAIPACALALIVDYLFSIVEKLVTPISLQTNSMNNRQTIEAKRFRQKIFLVSSLAIIIVIFISKLIGIRTYDTRNISIGSLMFTEQIILGNMVSDLIEENTNIKVNRKLGLGGTQIVFQALQKGNIDLYIEYTGTIYASILKYTPTNDIRYVYDISKKDCSDKYNIDVMKPFNFNNTYVLAIREDTAQEYNLKSISDIIPFSDDLVFCGTIEFMNRLDGITGLTNTYKMRFKNSIAIDDAPRYIAIASKEVDIVTAFSTDGLIKKFSLVTLKDDRNFFPPYYAVPVMRHEVVESYPEVVSLLENLGDNLTEEVMLDLNYQVDELQRDPRTVAREFLLNNGFIK